MQVLALVACGLPNARIAVDLGLSETTAKSRANRILTRPALENRVQATLYAHRTGLAGDTPEPPTAEPAR
ncbi:response regulator transcription factor [Streptomyces sp. CoH27]|uniref:response regulator transcription factor n=1 Tax=Streptomyces sp. CoH27 TaxID=2875763 RepID=UPI001CD73585|nr:LuxR C-terminal-related transcriptional regulator [Streptomyces sp. CoH27]